MYFFFVFSINRSFRKDCPFELSLRASEDGQSLVVRTFEESHNHEISRVRIINLSCTCTCTVPTHSVLPKHKHVLNFSKCFIDVSLLEAKLSLM